MQNHSNRRTPHFRSSFSPLKWVMQEMSYHEFSSKRHNYECPRNPVVLQENGIQVNFGAIILEGLQSSEITDKS